MSLTFSHCPPKENIQGGRIQSSESGIFLGSGERLEVGQRLSRLHQKRSNTLGLSLQHFRGTVELLPVSIHFPLHVINPPLLLFETLPFAMLIINSPGSGSFIHNHCSRTERLTNGPESAPIFEETRSPLP